MAVYVVSDNPQGDQETYERVVGDVAQSGQMPPPGAVFQVAGPADGGWRVISVWNSRDDFERFRDERLRPALEKAGASSDQVKISIFDAHSYMAGDLSGAVRPGQPA